MSVNFLDRQTIEFRSRWGAEIDGACFSEATTHRSGCWSSVRHSAPYGLIMCREPGLPRRITSKSRTIAALDLHRSAIWIRVECDLVKLPWMTVFSNFWFRCVSGSATVVPSTKRTGRPCQRHFRVQIYSSDALCEASKSRSSPAASVIVPGSRRLCWCCSSAIRQLIA